MEDSFPDDRVRLIFICCHPSLPVDARVAMALREVCGLTTEQIAAAFLASAPTIAQRIVRAKARIRDLALPYVVPGADELEQRVVQARASARIGRADPGVRGGQRA